MREIYKLSRIEMFGAKKSMVCRKKNREKSGKLAKIDKKSGRVKISGKFGSMIENMPKS